MQYRRFGKTDRSLSVFSLGTMRCLASEAIAHQTIKRAISLGITHLETARGYGQSERFLGAALRSGVGKARSDLFITTKTPPTSEIATLERDIDDSLERLGLTYLDALALHGINTLEHLAQAEQCLPILERMVADGRIRHLGFSTHGPLDVILAAIALERFAFINLHYSYFFQRNASAIAAAHDRDMGIFIISPADKGGLLYTPSPQLAALCQPFSPLELNYRFLLSDSRITTLSVGPANPGELDWPLQVSDRIGPLTEAEQTVFQHLETVQQERLGGDRCAQCYACLPCPESIHIPEVLRLRNLAVSYDMTQFGQYRYRMFENAGHWFPGRKASHCTDCGDCLPRCPSELDIPKLLRDTHDRLKGEERRRLWG